MKKKIFFIVGRSRTGKDTLTQMLSNELQIPVICSYTDRPRRKSEKEGKEHIFLSKKEMTDLVSHDKLLAYTQIGDSGYRYCTTESQLNGINRIFYIIDPNGIKDFKEKHGDKYEYVTILILADEKVRLERDDRGDFESYCERNKNEHEQFYEFESDNKNFDIFVTNNKDIENAYIELFQKIQKYL